MQPNVSYSNTLNLKNHLNVNQNSFYNLDGTFNDYSRESTDFVTYTRFMKKSFLFFNLYKGIKVKSSFCVTVDTFESNKKKIVWLNKYWFTYSIRILTLCKMMSEKETKEYQNTLENNQFTIFQVYKGKLDKLFWGVYPIQHTWKISSSTRDTHNRLT